MGKLKTATCPGCGKPINRHDTKRVTLVLANQGAIHRQGTKVTYHLKCHQETGI